MEDVKLTNRQFFFVHKEANALTVNDITLVDLRFKNLSWMLSSMSLFRIQIATVIWSKSFFFIKHSSDLLFSYVLTSLL